MTISTGITPDNSFPWNSSLHTFVKLPIVDGILPVRLLVCKEICSKLVKSPNDAGSSPLNSFPCKYKFFKFAKLPMVAGIVPVRLLLNNSTFVTSPSTTVTPCQVAISSMVVPCNQLVLLIQLAPSVLLYKSVSAWSSRASSTPSVTSYNAATSVAVIARS